MKLYFINPVGTRNSDGTFEDDKYAPTTQLTTPLISKMVFDCLEPHLDKSLYTIRSKNEISKGPERTPDDIFDDHILHNITDADDVYNWIYRSIDPSDGFWTEIKSRINCRHVLFGYDGQAVLCLRLEDPKPISPSPDIIEVIESTADLTHGDLFDGPGFED